MRSLTAVLSPDACARAQLVADSDAKRVRKHILKAFDQSLLRADAVEFVLSVRCFGYYGAVCSVWVYFGVLDHTERAGAATSSTFPDKAGPGAAGSRAASGPPPPSKFSK